MDELSGDDIANALGYWLNESEDGRSSLPVELIQREMETLMRDAIWRVILRRMREKYPHLCTTAVEAAAREKFTKISAYTTVAPYREYAKRNNVDELGNVFDGPW